MPFWGWKRRSPSDSIARTGQWWGVSDLHDHGDDHRAASGPFVDEAAGCLADVAAEGVEVGGALGGRLLEAVEHGLAGLFEKVVSLGGVDPAPGEDLGAADHLARAGVDGDDDD